MLNQWKIGKGFTKNFKLKSYYQFFDPSRRPTLHDKKTDLRRIEETGRLNIKKS